jgi:hypothetical protein
MDRYKRNCGRLVKNVECSVLRWQCSVSKWFWRWYIRCMDFVICLIFWKYDNILVNGSISILWWSLVLSNQAIWVVLFPFQLCMETYIVSDTSYTVWNTRWWPEPRKSIMTVSQWMLTMCILCSWFWHYFLTLFELRRLQWISDELEEI